MTITRAFTEDLHPRGTGAVGGQFVAASTAKTAPAKKTAPPAKKGAPAKKAAKPGGGNLSFDGKRGAGYGKPGGDKRVKGLQEALNRLGLTDGSGKKLMVDGKLGPKTTAAIKKAQRAAGMKADGVVTPAFLAQLAKTKKAGDLKAKKPPAKKAAAKKAMPAKKTAPPARKAAPPRRAQPKKINVGS